jgi:tetratricopeptide (TPR) repeat protein
MTRRLRAAAAVALASTVWLGAQGPVPALPAARRTFQGEDALVRVYDTILDARFDQVNAELRRACGPAPVEACDVLAATALWWRILLDSHSRILDDEFSASVERAIRTTEAWTDRAPEDAEAWFYLGAAYAARVQWRVLRNARLAAARDGKRIKGALERALELDPGLADAYFGIGLYRYYADVAPAAARFLRLLLLLPGGDREAGLEQMLRAREHGRLLQGEADYQLHLIYLWYEKDTDRALELLRALQRQYPGNPLFAIEIAGVQDAYQHDIMASLETWRTLLARAREQRVNLPTMAEARARLGIATQLEALYETDDAIGQLDAVTAARPSMPYGAYALAQLKLGEAHDRLGHRAQALAAYRAAAAAAPQDDPYDIAEETRRRVQQAPDPQRREAYRLSLEGWRRLEQHDLAGAAAALERSLSLMPHDPVARYRYGRVLQASREEMGALEQFEAAIRDGRIGPAPILAASYLEAARLHERAGHREQALEWYGAAATLFGGGRDTRAAAARALTRLQKLPRSSGSRP